MFPAAGPLSDNKGRADVLCMWWGGVPSRAIGRTRRAPTRKHAALRLWVNAQECPKDSKISIYISVHVKALSKSSNVHIESMSPSKLQSGTHSFSIIWNRTKRATALPAKLHVRMVRLHVKRSTVLASLKQPSSYATAAPPALPSPSASHSTQRAPTPPQRL